MKKLLALAVAGFAMVGSWGAIAQTLPNGPVASPPGWSCAAKGGAVYCVRKGPN